MMESNWISVKDKLPEKNSRVLAYYEGEIELMEYSAEYLRQEGFWVNENGGEYSDNYTNIVTHWMPLPEPPKQ